MWRLESFIKECLRLSDMDLLLITRKALKDFTFSNGMTIPAGNIVNVPCVPVHTDMSFDDFRFEKTRSQEGEEHKHQHPWPFFVINEVKVLLARVLFKNDVKMADGQDAPKSGNLELSLAHCKRVS
ncbi:hypothetical protein M378DRAFT_17456 [Amanita muscaria Koide BX008]|uniref:Uncharacterized protein n=1 Tax=Amanita muscaria (strain Koide BX008) TaxID=946122 RepID=A0A0C2WHB9_AMAMK|nr:hypothetical protein M378DRAFT_17456 [Amanita muscaria Koide BX008]